MLFQVKTVFPKEETAENNKLIERTFNKLVEGLELDEVVTLYEQLLNKEDSININFAPLNLIIEGLNQTYL